MRSRAWLVALPRTCRERPFEQQLPAVCPASQARFSRHQEHQLSLEECQRQKSPLSVCASFAAINGLTCSLMTGWIAYAPCPPCRLGVRHNRRATAGEDTRSSSDRYHTTPLHTATGAVPLPRSAVRSVQLQVMTCGYPGPMVPGECGTYAPAPNGPVLNNLVRFCLLRQECIKVP